MKKYLITAIIISGIVILSGIIKTQVIVSFNTENQINEQLILTSSLHEPIIILNNDNFTDYLFPGSGTVVAPYIIENYNITTDSYYGIYISRTTKYFIIRNCLVDAYSSGIYLYDIDDGTASIKDNICQANTNGIYLDYASRVTVSNNSCNDKNRDGIRLWHSDNSLIINNTCNNNWYNGIHIEKSSGVKLLNNLCFNNGNIYGYGWGDGIYVYSSDFVILTNNKCNNNRDYGIRLAYSSNATISSNTCNNSYSGIFLRDSHSATLTNILCNNHTYGIVLSYSDDITMSNSSCYDNQIDGIRLIHSSRAVLTNITSNFNIYTGIFLYFSHGTTLMHSSFSNNNDGIYSAVSDYVNLNNNNCSNNIDIGIKLRNSYKTSLVENMCESNEFGIYLDLSVSCELMYNLLLQNQMYGIYLGSGSNYNIIHHNSFINNNLEGTSQAYDEGIRNYWYDVNAMEGNHWSGWGENNTYHIDGFSESTDLYPLNEELERTHYRETTNYGFVLIIPTVILLAFVHSYKRKKKARNNN